MVSLERKYIIILSFPSLLMMVISNYCNSNNHLITQSSVIGLFIRYLMATWLVCKITRYPIIQCQNLLITLITYLLFVLGQLQMVVFKEFVDIWNGRDQLGSLRMGALDNLIFNSSKACWWFFVHIKSTFLIRKQNNGKKCLCKIFNEVSIVIDMLEEATYLFFIFWS